MSYTIEQVLRLAQQYRDTYGKNAHEVALKDLADGSLSWHEVEELLR